MKLISLLGNSQKLDGGAMFGNAPNDHAGGLFSAWEAGSKPTLLFPRARFFVSATHWQRATHPHPRDRASFLPELNRQMQESGRLNLVEGENHPWKISVLS